MILQKIHRDLKDPHEIFLGIAIILLYCSRFFSFCYRCFDVASDKIKICCLDIEKSYKSEETKAKRRTSSINRWRERTRGCRCVSIVDIIIASKMCKILHSETILLSKILEIVFFFLLF